jgi:hypothetical protein
MSDKRRFPNHGWVGLALLIISETLLFSRSVPVGEWFYPLAWWPYILVVDALVYLRKGTSLLTGSRREFILLLPCSVCLWLTFELFNLALKNWHYILVPEHLPLRWLGYVISYATVLPGLFETMQLLEAYGLFKESPVRPISSSKHWYIPFLVTGALFLILPLLWPKRFFPLVWGGFVFLLEPVNHRFGASSLMRQWEQGSLRNFYLLLVSGVICGLLWEFWNYWAITKWVYTIPHVGWLKVFEMPILGFLGFPPFAVECYVMMSTVSLFRKGRTWEKTAAPPGRRRPLADALVGLVLLIYSLFVFHQIDLHTVASWRP